MNMELTISGHKLNIHTPEHWEYNSENRKKRPDTFLYMHGMDKESDAFIHEHIDSESTAIVSIYGIDWNRDLSPWPSPKVFKNDEDFGGGADDYLNELTRTIIPEVEAHLGIKPAVRGIIGYSLAGLFSLYCLYKTDLFTLFGAMSPSVWFEGWIDFMKASPIAAANPRVYLSLGDKEKRTRNFRMSAVEDCIFKTEEILRQKNAEVAFEMNTGNHFAEIPQRISRGINQLLS